jgi:hypothetical protein
MSEMTPR